MGNVFSVIWFFVPSPRLIGVKAALSPEGMHPSGRTVCVRLDGDEMELPG